LIFELIGNAIRTLYGAVDPIGLRLILPYFWSLFFFASTVVIEMATNLLLLLFWNRAITIFGARSCARYRIPVYVFVGCTFALDLAGAIIRALEISDLMLIVTQVFYCLIIISVMAYLIYTTRQLYGFIKDPHLKGARAGPASKAVTMSRIVVVLLIIWPCQLVVSICIYAPFTRNPTGVWLITFLGYFFLAIASAAKSVIIIPREEQIHVGDTTESTGSGSTGSKGSKKGQPSSQSLTQATGLQNSSIAAFSEKSAAPAALAEASESVSKQQSAKEVDANQSSASASSSSSSAKARIQSSSAHDADEGYETIHS